MFQTRMEAEFSEKNASIGFSFDFYFTRKHRGGAAVSVFWIDLLPLNTSVTQRQKHTRETDLKKNGWKLAPAIKKELINED